MINVLQNKKVNESEIMEMFKKVFDGRPDLLDESRMYVGDYVLEPEGGMEKNEIDSVRALVEQTNGFSVEQFNDYSKFAEYFYKYCESLQKPSNPGQMGE